jgi:hypothetical protein
VQRVLELVPASRLPTPNASIYIKACGIRKPLLKAAVGAKPTKNKRTLVK